MGTVASLIRIDTRRKQLVDAALAPDVLIGMPHLTPFGLSETWLLKELAHRHWLMLGQSMGLKDADFRTPDGGEVYAAICAVALRNAELSELAANDILSISSRLAPVSRTRMISSHRLSVDGRYVGEVELLSAFVNRANGAIARVRHQRFEAHGSCFTSSPLADQAAKIRRGDFIAAGLSELNGPVLRHYVFAPSQLQDFNGANLFYFANYQSAIDRAMEGWFGVASHRASKQTHYLGNIVAGETITVKLLDGPGNWLVIERASGEPIAYQMSEP